MSGATAGLQSGTGVAGHLEASQNLFNRPPGLLFHLVPGVFTLAFLWAFTVPGINFLLAGGAFLNLAVCGLGWAVRLGTYLFARRRGRAEGRPQWFVVAPAAGLIVLLLLWAEIPLRARWATSRGDFENALELAPQAGDRDEWTSFDVPGRLGSYEVLSADRVGDGVIFHEVTGVFANDAGFAYLPSGPYDELETGLFEAPEFRSLGGGWYAWTASW